MEAVEAPKKRWRRRYKKTGIPVKSNTKEYGNMYYALRVHKVKLWEVEPIVV